jgi:broad specificity phosphatase PhoE
LVFIRHGECVANATGVAGGHRGDGGLTETGRRQAEELARRLTRTQELRDVTALYTSTMPRAIETGAIVNQVLHLKPVALDEVCEVNVGEGDGLAWPEFIARFGNPGWDDDPSVACAPGGESLVTFYERAESALAGLTKRHPDERVVVVSHGGFIEQVMKIYQGVGAAARLRPRIEHCSMTELEYNGTSWRLLRYNDMAPLPVE